MVKFPSWWRPIEGAPVLFAAEAEVPKGWEHVPGDYDIQTGQWVDPDPLDHDFDGEKGGSVTAPGDLKALRAEYKRVIGKAPFNGWDEATLREKMAAK